ncbi:unnamed protein product [Closterium sp. NIES-53]
MDADEAGNKQNWASIGGYVFIFRGAAVFWSTHQVHDALLLDVGTVTILRVDNQSAITVAENLGLKGNLKHMERHHPWLQQMVKHRKITLKYIPTSEQPADFLTKALHFLAFNWCSVTIGQVCMAGICDGDNDVQQ